MGLLDIIYPRVCPVCAKPVRRDYLLKGENNNIPKDIGMEKLICPHCYNRLPFIKPPTCLKCGKHIEDGTKAYCADCDEKDRPFEKCISIMDYSDEIAGRMMWDLKYKNRREYADLLALIIAQKNAAQIVSWRCDALVPVPVHPSKRKSRGYNQTELVANRLGELLDIPVKPQVLIRARKTVPQKGLDADARARNLKSAFAPGEEACPKRVILLDDIYTTGATMRVCTDVLLASGAQMVFGICCCAGSN